MSDDKRILFFSLGGEARTKAVLRQDWDVVVVRSLDELRAATPRDSHYRFVVIDESPPEADKIEAGKIIRRRLPLVALIEVCIEKPCISGAEYVVRSTDPNRLRSLLWALMNLRSRESSQSA